jgi:hypothetical protein
VRTSAWRYSLTGRHPFPTPRRRRIWAGTITPIGHSECPRWDGHNYIDASTVVVAREKHEGNESEDGDQGAPPLAIFPFEKFDTSLERFRGRPRISSASWFLGHDFTSLAGPYLRRVQIATYHLEQPVAFLVSTSWCPVPM